MAKHVREYLILTFFIMAFGWGVCFLCSAFGIYLTEHPLLYVPFLLGGLSPTIASYIALRRNHIVYSFREWVNRVFDFKHKLLSYLLLPGLAAVFFLSLCLISGYEAGAPLFAVVFMLPAMLFGGGLEEVGWRDILQPELEKKFGFSVGTGITAIIWWLWHLPLFYINGVSQYGADFFAFGLNILGLSFGLAAIKKVTDSTFLCVLFHCLINSLHGVYIIDENFLGNVAAAAVLILLSYAVIRIQKKFRLFA